MKGFVLSSDVPEAPLTEAGVVALMKGLRRLEEWWRAHLVPEWDNLVNVAVEWSPEVGAILGNPDFAVVHVTADPPPTPQTLANHSVDAQGRPVATIFWQTVRGEGGESIWPSLSHEVFEARIDPTCQRHVTNPDGLLEPLEVCDRVQGSDYEEPDSPGIRLANAAGPAFFEASSEGPWTIASDVGPEPASHAFDELPGGYHVAISPATGDTYTTFGDEVSAPSRARLLETGPRGGLWRDSR